MQQEYSLTNWKAHKANVDVNDFATPKDMGDTPMINSFQLFETKRSNLFFLEQ